MRDFHLRGFLISMMLMLNYGGYTLTMISMNCFYSTLYQFRKPDSRIFSLQLYNLLDESHSKTQSQSIATRKMTFWHSSVTCVTAVYVWDLQNPSALALGWDITWEPLEQHLYSGWHPESDNAKSQMWASE